MLELTGGLGADVAIEAVGVPETFELCTELVRPGGRIANVGVHGHPATLHLEKLWIKDVTITTGLVDTQHDAQAAAADRRRQTRPDGLRHAPLRARRDQEAYEVFADAGANDALKVVLSGQPLPLEPRTRRELVTA